MDYFRLPRWWTEGGDIIAQENCVYLKKRSNKYTAWITIDMKLF